MLTTPIFVLLMTPWIRPLRASRLMFTYLIPIVPLVVLWDGLVSCLRTYAVEEMGELTSSLGGPPYLWETRRIRSDGSPFPVIYTIGRPRPAGHR
jgi:hypothetical protein